MFESSRRRFLAVLSTAFASTSSAPAPMPGRRAGIPEGRSYPRTAAEIKAGVVPVSLEYPYPNVFRYMTAAQIADVVGKGFERDVTAAIQTLINVGEKQAYFPAGLYKTTAAIRIPATGGWHVWGDGKSHTEIRGHGVFDPSSPGTSCIFCIGNADAQSIRGSYEDLCVSGKGATVRFGIYGSRVEEHDFSRVWCSFFTVAGASIGYGYVNNYFQCEFSYNGGDGLLFNVDHDRANNANSILQCMMLENAGFGFRGEGGNGLWITDCTIEQNKKGGIFNGGISGMYVRAYFEANGAEGWTFSKPALTVKADILLTGGAYTEMSAAFPSQGVVIESCTTEPLKTAQAFVWNGGAVDLTVRNCKTGKPGAVPVVAEHYDNAYKGENVTIENCTSFTTALVEVGARSGVNNSFAGLVRIRPVAAHNYAQTDLARWKRLAKGAQAEDPRAFRATTRQYHGRPVWEIAAPAAGASDVQGFQIDAASAPELRGRAMWFGMWVYATDAECYAVPYCSAQDFNDNPTRLGNWTFLAVSFVWPASGILSFGVAKRGRRPGSVSFAAPMLSELGVHRDDAINLTAR